MLVFVVYNRRHESHIKYPGPDDDVRENIINYDDEGGGEDDMTAFDITPLQIPIGSTIPEAVQCKMPIMCKCFSCGFRTTEGERRRRSGGGVNRRKSGKYRLEIYSCDDEAEDC